MPAMMVLHVPHVQLATLVLPASPAYPITIPLLLVLWSAAPAQSSTSTATNAAMEPFAQFALLDSPLLCAMSVLWDTRELDAQFVTWATLPTTELAILAQSSVFTAMPAAMELPVAPARLDILALPANPARLDITTRQLSTILLPAALAQSLV